MVTKSNKSKTVIPKTISGESEKEYTTGIEPNAIKAETKNNALKKDNLYLCKNEYDMEELLKKLPSRLDYKNLNLRKNQLSEFNTPFQYSKKISILLRGLVF